MAAPVDASYLADTVMLLRYFEDDGRVFAGSVPLEQLQAAAEGR